MTAPAAPPAAARAAAARFLVVVRPAAGEPDPRAAALLGAARELGVGGIGAAASAALYELAGSSLTEAAAREVAAALLADPVTERIEVVALGGVGAGARADAEAPGEPARGRHAARADVRHAVVIHRRPGVMDPVLLTLREALADLGRGEVERARRGTLYEVEVAADLPAEAAREALARIARRALSNPVIEDVAFGRELPPERPAAEASAARVEIPLHRDGLDALRALNRTRGLALSEPELEAVAARFRLIERRDPTTCELETLAQTWSEHCKHKTMAGPVRYAGPPPEDLGAAPIERRYESLLKETIFRVTRDLDRRDLCLSVFVDNAGVIALDEARGVCMKVETHNHPSALEPYGGAGTGVGGVIRDVLGTGLGARPVASLSAFGFGLPDTRPEDLPAGALHPRRVLRGVVAGVRDYGNCMGIPTVAGAVVFDRRFAANPVVFCGTVGVLPRDAIAKAARPGDRIVLLGGRTGRDGIHGATFSSMELSGESEARSSGAVQIGNPIEEKRVLEALLAMREQGLLHAVTDCGAGGLSSAVGEMGEATGALVLLERVPLKYEGLAPEEIWISEAQERMVLAVAPERLDAVRAVAAAEGVEATDIGSFTGDGRLRVHFRGEELASLDSGFLHDGVPRVERRASFAAPEPASDATPRGGLALGSAADALLEVLGSWQGCSREAIVRQYDHEVQGLSAIKPYGGVRGDGPADAAVIAAPPAEWLPVARSSAAPSAPPAAPPAAQAAGEPVLGIAIGCGLDPGFEKDPYRMARAAVDEAIRNVVAVGADPDRIGLLDNFAWGDCSLPDRLGALVLACEGAASAARSFGAPFISGKDSLNNELRHPDGSRTAVPPTLLISALAIHPDLARACSSDLHREGHRLALVGVTREELGGSLLARLRGVDAGPPPVVFAEAALARYRALHRAMQSGLVVACHDLSEGGLAAAAAEMAIGGRLGARLDLAPLTRGGLTRAAVLFGESTGRLLCEVAPAFAEAFERALPAGEVAWIGEVTGGRSALGPAAAADEARLVIVDGEDAVLSLGVEHLARVYSEPLARELA